jgi:GNAT superfamily N-acetyltransferase
MRLSDDPQTLAVTLPDAPRWVETRSLLLSGEAILRIGGDGDAGVVVDAGFPSGAVVGRADRRLLQSTLADVPSDFELLVQMDALAQAQEALPGWTVSIAVVHALTRPYESSGGTDPGVVVSQPPDERWLGQLPEDIREYASVAHAVAVRVVGDEVLAVCAAGDVTETLWDVGIDTLEGHRRRGYAIACFHGLAAHMAAHGKQPVWSAYADYPPSMKLAVKLGFQPVDRVAVLSPGARPSP